jgi:hypothetical protein
LSPPTPPTPPSENSPESAVATASGRFASLRNRAEDAAAGGAAAASPNATDRLARDPEKSGGIVVNETNMRLFVNAPDGKQLILAPLERRTLAKDDYDTFKPLLEELQRRSAVALPPKEASEAIGLIVGGAIWALIVFGIIGLFRGSMTYWVGGAAAIALAVVILVVANRTGIPAVLRWTLQFAALILILAVGIGLPGSAIYFSAGVDQLVQAAYFDGTMAKEELDLTLLGRGLQLVFLAAVSLLPALLYFLFDRQQLRTLREQFERHMFRLDSNMTTLNDIRARYGTLIAEAYGPEAARGGGRLLPGRRSPVLLATIVITLGWLLTLLKPEIGLITDRDGIVQLFQPDRSAIVFGFLGAYFFTLMTIQRGYARGDLRPKTYTQITVRIFIAIILAWVLELLPGADNASYLLVLAFAAGIVPETAILAIRETLRGKPGREFGRWMAERDPLTRLEGIDLYDRARLGDEGITNVEGLAHHDLIELLLQTRIPAPRLVDWIDQAILYLHVGSSDAEVASSDADEPDASRERSLRLLNASGIRTATDLVQAAERTRDKDAFDRILPPVGDPEAPPRLSLILETIEDEEWMDNLDHWHRSAQFEVESIRWPPPPDVPGGPPDADVASDGGNGRDGEPATPASRARAG